MGKALGVITGVALQLVAPTIGSIVGGPFGAFVGRAIASFGSAKILSGISTLASSLFTKSKKPDTTVSTQKQSIPPRIKARGRLRLHGYYTLFETASDGSAVDAYAFAEGPSAGNEIIYINDDKVTVNSGVVNALPDKKYQGGNVQLGFSYGSNPNFAFSAITAKIPDWNASYRGDGVCTGYLIKRPEKDKYFIETYPQGDNTDISRVDKWGYFFDPRDPTQNIAHDPAIPEMWSGGNYIGSWKWNENPVIHILDYLIFERGYSYEKRIVPTMQYWVNAADICDEQIPLKSGGYEPRYRSSVSYPMTDPEKDVLAAHIETFDGWMQERGDGSFVIYAGKVYNPTVTIGPDEIINANLQNFVETENGIDQVKVTYISAAHDYTEVEATPWGGENGALRVGTIDAATPSYSQNRRLAKRIMDRTNAPQRGSITTTLAGRKVRGQRYIYLNHTECDITFFAGIVEITKLSRNFETGGFDFDWIAVDPNIDSWNPATEEGEGAAVGDRVAPEPLEDPVLISATAQFSNLGQSSGDDGTVVGGNPQDVTGVTLNLTASGPGARGDLTWYARWRVGMGIWRENQYADNDLGVGVTLVTDYVPYGVNVESQVAYSTGGGQVSDWSNSKITNTTKP